MKIKNFIKKHNKIEYISKCLYRIHDKEFRNFILAIDRDFGIFRFEHLGNENTDKNIYVIEIDASDGFGMFAMLRNTIEKLAYADRFSLIPVVRWGKNTLYSQECKEFINKDTFEYYFEPITIEKPNTIKNSYMIAHSRKSDRIICTNLTYNISDDEIEEMGKIYKKYIQLNKESKQYIFFNIQNFFKEQKILGVHVRGTDYFKIYNGHPVAVTAEEYLNATKQAIREQKYEKVFLATDEASVINKFYQEFKEKLLFYSDVFRSEDNLPVHGSENERPMHKYMLGLEVLRDMYSLAKCDGLIAGLSNVPMFARVVKCSLGEKYSFQRIFDKGTYTNNNKCTAKTVKLNES